MCVCVCVLALLARQWGQVQGWIGITSTGSAQDKQGLFPCLQGLCFPGTLRDGKDTM